MKKMNFENERNKFEFWKDCNEPDNFTVSHSSDDNVEFSSDCTDSGQEQLNVSINLDDSTVSSRPIQTHTNVERRSTRIRKPPNYLKDYVN